MARSERLSYFVLYAASMKDVHLLFLSFLTGEDKVALAMTRIEPQPRLYYHADLQMMEGLAQHCGNLEYRVWNRIYHVLKTVMCSNCNLKPNMQSCWVIGRHRMHPTSAELFMDEYPASWDTSTPRDKTRCVVCNITAFIKQTDTHRAYCHHYLPTFVSVDYPDDALYVSADHAERIKATLKHNGFVVCLHCRKIWWGKPRNRRSYELLKTGMELHLETTGTMLTSDMLRCAKKMMKTDATSTYVTGYIEPSPCHYIHQAGPVRCSVSHTVAWQNHWEIAIPEDYGKPRGDDTSGERPSKRRCRR